MKTRLAHLLGWRLLLALTACGTPLARSASPSSSAGPAQPRAPASAPSNGTIAATAPDGTPLWAFDPKTLGVVGPTFVTAGPNLLAVGRGTGPRHRPSWDSDLALGTLVGVLHP